MIQLQPTQNNREQWDALAEREGLFYEVLEPSMPLLLGDAAAREAYCAVMRDGGRVRSLHGAFIGIDPASGDPDLRYLSQRRCRESCALAARLGARNVVFHASSFPFLRGPYLDRWAEVCAEFYQGLTQIWDVDIFVENSADLDPEPLRALMRCIADERIRVCLDLGHANYSRVPLRGWFDALGGRIGYLHLSDNGGAFDDHLPLGAGSVDWEEADRLWRGLGREIPLTLEVGGIEGVERSLRYLKERGYFGTEARDNAR